MLSFLKAVSPWSQSCVNGPPSRAEPAIEPGADKLVAQATYSLSLPEYKKHVEFVAKPRPPNSKQWRRVQNYIATNFENLGFEVTRSKYATGVNIIATLRGSTAPAEEVWLSAHYDSLRQTPGADDNASGVAAVLSLARALGAQRPERTLKLGLWDEEERGLVGSCAHMERVAARRTHIVASIVFEMIAFTRGDDTGMQNYISVLADGASAPLQDMFVQQAQREGLRAKPHRRGWLRSDHVAFWEQGYPALLLFDGCEKRNPNYHRSGDVPASLDYHFAMRVVRTSLVCAQQALQAQGIRVPPPARMTDAFDREVRQSLKLRRLYSHQALIAAAVDSGARMGDKRETPLMLAARRKEVPLVRALLAQGTNVHDTDARGMTALDHALSAESYDVGLVLLRAGAPVEHLHAQYGTTPLMFFVQSGRRDLVQAALAMGANIYASTENDKVVSDYADPSLSSFIKKYMMTSELTQRWHVTHADEGKPRSGATLAMGEIAPMSPTLPLSAQRTCKNPRSLLHDPIEEVPELYYIQLGDWGFHIQELVDYFLTINEAANPYEDQKPFTSADLVAITHHPSGLGAAVARLKSAPPRFPAPWIDTLWIAAVAMGRDHDIRRGYPTATAILVPLKEAYDVLSPSTRAAFDAHNIRGYPLGDLIVDVCRGQVCIKWAGYSLYKLLRAHSEAHGFPTQRLIRDLEKATKHDHVHRR